MKLLTYRFNRGGGSVLPKPIPLLILFSILIILSSSSKVEEEKELSPDLFLIDPEIFYSEEIEYAKLHDPHKRILQNTIFTQESLESGTWVLYALGSIYLFVAIYLIFNKFLHHIIEDLVFLIDVREDLFRPVVYCILNSMPYLILSTVSVFDTNSNLAVGTIIGSDAYNIFLVFGMIVLKNFNEENNIDNWLYFRDFTIYLVGIVLVIISFFKKQLPWWLSMIIVLYYIVFYFVQSQNEAIRDLFYRLVGSTHDEDSFNADEHFQYKKRRDSLTFLNENSHIDKLDPALVKKLSRTEAILRINLKDKPAKYKVYANFQRLVYIIMFGLRNKVKFEKTQRANQYAALFKKSEKETKKVDNNSDSDNENTKKGKTDVDNIKRQGSSLNENADNIPLLKNKKNDEDASENHAKEDKKAELPAFQLNRDDDQPAKEDKPSGYNSSGNGLNLRSAGGPGNSGGLNPGLDDGEDEEDEVSLRFPQGLWKRIFWLFTLPINCILYFLPNYKKAPTVKKLAQTLILNLILITLIIYLLNQWMQLVCMGSHIMPETLGITFSALGFTFPFMKYNLKIASNDKDVDFMQSFLQLGIYKIGICLGLPWLLYNIIYRDFLNLGYKSTQFSIVVIVYIFLVVCTMLIMLLSKFKLSTTAAVIYIIFFVGFIISGICLMQV